MKKPIISAISKFTLGAVLFSTVLTTSAHATGNGVSEGKKAEVNYVGSAEDALYFSVSYENPDNHRFTITVLDEEGTKLFQGAFSDKNFAKRFKLPKTDKNKVTFVISEDKNVELKQTFEINTRIVEDLVVTRL